MVLRPVRPIYKLLEASLGTVWAASMVTIHVYSQTVKDISRHVSKITLGESSRI